MALSSDRPIVWGAAAAVVAGVIALYLYAHREKPEATTTASAPVDQQVVASEPPKVVVGSSAPVIEHPAPQDSAPSSEPVPALDQSDASFHAALARLPGGEALEKLLVPDNIIRHLVVTVDNLSRKKIAVGQRPIKPTEGRFMTLSNGDQVTISPENYARYQPFVALVQALDVAKTVQVYYAFYPLFQSAFDDLGYQNAYFNDHLVAAIDHLLATPEVTGPVALVQPNVMYLYADPALEALSPGQKTLIRMGPANEALLKARLRELKAQLLAQQHK